MSYVLVFNKTNATAGFESSDLKSYLCPYDAEVTQKSINSSIHFFYNNFSDITETNEHVLLKTPAGHNSEVNSAWSIVQCSLQEILFDTDPLSQCPVWYAENSELLVVGLEQKAMQFFIKIEQMHRLPQGSQLKINLVSKKFSVKIINKTPWSNFVTESEMDLTQAQELLFKALKNSAAVIPNIKTAVFLSGGIDSSVAASVSKARISRSYNLTTYLGDEKKQSEETSSYLQIPSCAVELKQSEIFDRLKSVVFANELVDGLTAEILLQLSKLVQETPESQIVTGYGADLLFGGMLRHSAYLAATGTHDTVSLLNRTHWSLEFSPFYYWQKRKRVFHLFWHPEVIACALKIPISLQFVGTADKHVLRSMAVQKKLLTQDLAFRPKLGMTNGTQVNDMLSKYLGLDSENEYAKKTDEVVRLFKGIFFK